MKTLMMIAGVAVFLLLAARIKPDADASADDTAQLRSLEGREQEAVNSGKPDELSSLYVQDESLIVFDDEVPFEYTGIDAWRKALEGSRSTVRSQEFHWIRPAKIMVDDGIAVEAGIAHWTNVYKDGRKFEYDYRVTQCWKRAGGQWRIFHAHYSAPFEEATGKAVFTAKP